LWLRSGDTTSIGTEIRTVRGKVLEDPLSYLPRSLIVDIRKGQVIDSQTIPSTKIYLVVAGTVKVCRIAKEGRKILVDIYGPDEFFGESAFAGSPESNEIASALENTQVMTWAASEIEQLALARPQLAGCSAALFLFASGCCVATQEEIGNVPDLRCRGRNLVDRPNLVMNNTYIVLNSEHVTPAPPLA
jgi:hypothetical protein